MKEGFKGIEDDRTGWQAYRKGKCGSSQVGTILGLNRWQSAYQLWAVETGRIPEEPHGDAALFGRLVEPAIQQLWAHNHPGVKVDDCQTTYEHEDYPWAIASPDAWITPFIGEEIVEESTGEFIAKNGQRGLLECKHTAVFSDDWDDGIPDVHHVQTQWQLGVLNVDYAYVAAIIGGRANDLKSFLVRFDKGLFTTLIEKVKEFRRCVDEDEPPEAVAADIKLLDKLSNRRDTTIELGPQYDSVVKEYDEARQQRLAVQKEVTHWDKKQKDAEAKLRQYMATANRGITTDGRMVVLKRNVREPRMTKESVFWTLRIKEM